MVNLVKKYLFSYHNRLTTVNERDDTVNSLSIYVYFNVIWLNSVKFFRLVNEMSGNRTVGVERDPYLIFRPHLVRVHGFVEPWSGVPHKRFW